MSLKKKSKTQLEKRKEREERAVAYKEKYTAPKLKTVLNDILSRIPPTSEIPEDIVATIMEIEDEQGKKLTRQHLMVHALVNRAMQGSVDAFREIADRTEGKVANKNENKNLNVTYEDWLKKQSGVTDDEEPES